jgi:2-C-methyl-D-erythritol 2,4-cyclodiphosphate synthase
VIDALIGAAGRGDIGQWFPDSEERYRGARSLILLGQVAASLGADGWRVSNVDSSVVAQRPRLAPHLEAMRANIAEALGVKPEDVNVKATSPEYVGSLGREDAIVALAMVLLERDE